MAALAFGLATFFCTLACALIGIYIRSKLPAAHVNKESQDVIRLGMGLVATMTALLLGLVTAAAKGSYDSTDAAVRNAAAGMLTLDRLLARYGPETKPTRELLRKTVADRIDEIWPASGVTPKSLDFLTAPTHAVPAGEAIENQILALDPHTEAQKWFKSEALKLTEEVLRTRWRLLGSANGSVSRTFLYVVICWLSVTFASFGLSAPRNATVATAFVIAALSVAAAVFLILELDGPFEGIVKISAAPIQHTLANLGQ
jgi:hypothetical protein